MKKIAEKLALGNFQSSSGKTPEFVEFAKAFKKAWKMELLSIGATDIICSFGHFYISGFFTIGSQCYYFSLSDVRSPITEMLYRTAENNGDYTGGSNRYIKIGPGMAEGMRLTETDFKGK